MTDISHIMGGDLSLSATGDLQVADGAVYTQQRVLRRLLTNPGGYIWHTGYGAGLARFVGQVAVAARIAAVIRRQMLLERGVGLQPRLVVNVTAGVDNLVVADVRYADQDGTPQSLTVRP